MHAWCSPQRVHAARYIMQPNKTIGMSHRTGELTPARPPPRFNVGIILLCEIPCIQFCTTAFSIYARVTAISGA